MKRMRRTSAEVFGMSFLDVVSCAFGAMVALLMLIDEAPDEVVTDEPDNLEELIDYSSMITEANEQASKLRTRQASLQGDLRDIDNNLDALASTLAQLQTPEVAPKAVQGTMRSIYSGGIPVGETHVIFVIDNSGSMRANWDRVTEVLYDILEAHPEVEGLQILSDMGDSLIAGYDKRWIPDTPSARKNLKDSLARMSGFSNSSPVEGIERALRVYASKADSLSIYVFGDDFTGNSYDEVLTRVSTLNTKSGSKFAKIHGVGFPWGIEDRFATLMRAIANQNNGVFVGLDN
jgi:hypothetical protein